MPGTSPLECVRALCLSFPETSERLSHGQPSFFIAGRKTFVMYLDDHHGDGRLALWLAAPEGMQQALVEAAPEHYFRPPTSATAGGSASAWTATWPGTRSRAPSRTPTSQSRPSV